MNFFSMNKIGLILPILFSLIFTLHINVYPQMKGDILLAEKPFHLKFYDKYKQSMSDNQKAEFLPFTPILIEEIDKSQPLNPLRKVIISSEPYYLGITSGKQIIGYNKAGKKIFLHRWKKIDDLRFVPIDKEREFTLPAGNAVKLKKGTLIKLLFYKRNKYLIRLKNKNEFGFIYLRRDEIKTLLKSRKSKKILEKKRINKIESEVKDYNKRMTNLFNTFNKKYHQSKIAPFFREVPIKNGLKFIFKNGNVADYTRSVSALKKKLEVVLIGTSFKIRGERNFIIVTR